MIDWNQLITDFLNPPNTYQQLTVDRVLVALLISFIINMFIFYIYRKTFKGVIYTREFNVGLVLTGLVVTLVVLPISSNIALSLGMVGALSIIRFRTAIKPQRHRLHILGHSRWNYLRRRLIHDRHSRCPCNRLAITCTGKNKFPRS